MQVAKANKPERKRQNKPKKKLHKLPGHSNLQGLFLMA